MTTHDVSVSGRPDMGDDPLAALMTAANALAVAAFDQGVQAARDTTGRTVPFVVEELVAVEREVARLVVRVLEGIDQLAWHPKDGRDALADWRKRAEE